MRTTGGTGARRVRPKPRYAIPQRVDELLRKFDYPEILPLAGVGGGEGGPTMVHVVIGSTSEPADIQDKCDYVVPSGGSTFMLQQAFDDIAARSGGGVWSVWMVGEFELDGDVSSGGCWVRGLGYSATAE